MSHKLSLDLPLEWIAISTVEENFNQFNKCESLWSDKPQKVTGDRAFPPTTVRELEEHIKLLCGHDKNDTQEKIELMHERLSDGRLFNDPFIYFRIKTKLDKCPLCGASMEDGDKALSRRDNKTEICSRCGDAEALADFIKLV